MAESELPDNGPGAAIAMLDPAAGHCLRRRWWLLPASGRRGAALHRHRQHPQPEYRRARRHPHSSRLDLYRGSDMNMYVMYQWKHNCLARIGC
jgi:hypothetical protein